LRTSSLQRASDALFCTSNRFVTGTIPIRNAHAARFRNGDPKPRKAVDDNYDIIMENKLV